MTRAEEIIAGLFRKFFEPKSDLELWQWLEQFVCLPKTAQYPGPLNTGLVPFSRGIYDAYQDPRIRFIVLAKSAQVGGTLILKNVMTWSVSENPGPALYVTSNEKNCQKVRPSREQIIDRRSQWQSCYAKRSSVDASVPTPVWRIHSRGDGSWLS
jgi:phage terminase large subunit GpA-like protein